MLSPLQEQKGENIPWNRFGLWDDRKNIVIFQKTAEDKVESLLQVWCTGWHRLVFVFEFVYSNNYCPLIVTALGLHCVPWLSSWGKWAPAATHCVWDLSSPTRNWTCVPCIGRRILNHCPPEKILFHPSAKFLRDKTSMSQYFTKTASHLPLVRYIHRYWY